MAFISSPTSLCVQTLSEQLLYIEPEVEMYSSSNEPSAFFKNSPGTYPIPTVICMVALIVIGIYTAYSPGTRFSFYIGAPMLILYFIIGTYMYKTGKFKEPNYKPYLDAHINDTKVE